MEIEGGSETIVVVVVIVFVDDVDDGCRDLIDDFGVITCRTGDRDVARCDAAGDAFFNGENKSKSSKLTRSISLDGGGGGGGGGGSELAMVGGVLFSTIVRLRLRAGVCDDDDETDGERDRCRVCFRVLFVTDELAISMGSVSSTNHFFSGALFRSYSASVTNGVNFDFFFFNGD